MKEGSVFHSTLDQKKKKKKTFSVMFVPKVMTPAGRHHQSTVPSIKIFWGLVLKLCGNRIVPSALCNYVSFVCITKCTITNVLLNKSWVFLCLAEAPTVLPRRDENVRNSSTSPRNADMWDREQKERKKEKESINLSDVRRKFSVSTK